MSYTTLRTWLKDHSIPLHPTTVIYVPKTETDAYGLEPWAELPHGSYLGNSVPPAILDQPFNPDYGTQEIPDILIWTQDRIYYVYEYDGATCLHSVPRSPFPTTPIQG